MKDENLPAFIHGDTASSYVLDLARAIADLHSDHYYRCSGPAHIFPDACPVFKAWDQRRLDELVMTKEK